MILLVVIAVTGATYGLTDSRVLTNEFIGTTGTSPPGGSGGTVTAAVLKIWVPARDHPDSVRVQLYRNGIPYGDSVELEDGNQWRYKWTGLSKYYTWTVDELNVPTGYIKTMYGSVRDGFVITNTLQSGTITPPPGTPPETIKPPTPPPGEGGNPNTQGDEESPGPDDTPNPETTPGSEDTPKPGKPGTPGSGPKTGDDANPGLWLILLSVSVFLLRRVLFFGKKHKTKTKKLI